MRIVNLVSPLHAAHSYLAVQVTPFFLTLCTIGEIEFSVILNSGNVSFYIGSAV